MKKFDLLNWYIVESILAVIFLIIINSSYVIYADYDSMENYQTSSTFSVSFQPSKENGIKGIDAIVEYKKEDGTSKEHINCYLVDGFLYEKDSRQCIGAFGGRDTFYFIDGYGKIVAVCVSSSAQNLTRIVIISLCVIGGIIVGGAIYNKKQDKKYNSFKKGSN